MWPTARRKVLASLPARMIADTRSRGISILPTIEPWRGFLTFGGRAGAAAGGSAGTGSGGAVPEGTEGYVHASRLIILAIITFFLVMIRVAWKRNRYNDREEFPVVEDTPAGVIVDARTAEAR